MSLSLLVFSLKYKPVPTGSLGIDKNLSGVHCYCGARALVAQG
jgi:hypothetical protein